MLTKALEFAYGEIPEHLARSDAAGTVERPDVQRGRERVCEAEREHERDPPYTHGVST